jgi:hypothetical protein
LEYLGEVGWMRFEWGIIRVLVFGVCCQLELGFWVILIQQADLLHY